MPKKTTSPMTECDNCGRRVLLEDLLRQLEDIEDLRQRISPGCEVPAGECPCGALAYLVKPQKKLKVLVEVLGGVAEVTKCPKEVEVKIKDHDNDKHQ